MTSAEIVEEIERLPSQEQAEIQEALARLLGQPKPFTAARGPTSPAKLAEAARALLGDYQTDPELIAFTALDSEEFHAAR